MPVSRQLDLAPRPPQFYYQPGAKAFGQDRLPWPNSVMGISSYVSHVRLSCLCLGYKNKSHLGEFSHGFQHVHQKIHHRQFSQKDNMAKHLYFAPKKSARIVHHAKIEYRISTTIQEEIEFFRVGLHPSSKLIFKSPIAHLIPQMPTPTSYGEVCLGAAGGYSEELRLFGTFASHPIL